MQRPRKKNMNKAYYKRLMQHAESCQAEADKTSYQLTTIIEEISILSSVQSICDFNLFWLSGISPLIIYDKTLKFLNENKSKFKRKLSIKEIIEYDWIIAHNEISDFKKFINLVKRRRHRKHK